MEGNLHLTTPLFCHTIGTLQKHLYQCMRHGISEVDAQAAEVGVTYWMQRTLGGMSLIFAYRSISV